MTPRPSAADYAAAEAFVASTYDADKTVSRRWLAPRRAKLARYAADAEMQKRLFREAVERSKRADRRSMSVIENELPAIRAEMREIFEEQTP